MIIEIIYIYHSIRSNFSSPSILSHLPLINFIDSVLVLIFLLTLHFLLFDIFISLEHRLIVLFPLNPYQNACHIFCQSIIIVDSLAMIRWLFHKWYLFKSSSLMFVLFAFNLVVEIIRCICRRLLLHFIDRMPQLQSLTTSHYPFLAHTKGASTIERLDLRQCCLKTFELLPQHLLYFKMLFLDCPLIYPKDIFQIIVPLFHNIPSLRSIYSPYWYICDLDRTPYE